MTSEHTSEVGTVGEEDEGCAEGEGAPPAFAPLFGASGEGELEPGASAVVDTGDEKEAQLEMDTLLTRHRLKGAIDVFSREQVDVATVRELSKYEFGDWITEMKFSTIQKKRLWKLFDELHSYSESHSAMLELRERAVAVCPLFLEAIKDNDFAKFKLFWINRKVRADATFKCWLGNENALHWAAYYGRADVAEYLLADGTLDVNSEATLGMSALMFAAMNGKGAVLRLLLAVATVRVNHQDSDGWTALIHAANYGRLQCVKLLVNSGKASLSMRTKKGESALDKAKEYKRKSIVKYLEPMHGLH